MRSRLHIGIDAHGYRSLYSHGRGDGVNGAQFRLRFHIEAVNALFQGVADFRLCFSHAGIGAFGRVPPGLEDAKEFSAGNDVEPRAIAGHEVQDGDVGAGLDGVGHFRVKGRQGFPEAVEMVQNGLLAVDVQGGAFLVRQFLEVDVFTVERAVFICE